MKGYIAVQGLDQNRIFLITGGAGGIGHAVAVTLAKAGSRVVITDVDPVAGKAAAESITAETGSEARFVAMDVTNEEEVALVSTQLEAEGWPVYGVMANAGIAPASESEDYPAALWRKTIDINLNGVFWTAQAFGKRMLERGEGVVLITSSIAAFGVVSPEKHAAYGASKAAVAHLAEILGVEWAARGVRVNAVAPGYTATPILDKLKSESPAVYDEWIARTPAGRLNTPQEIANSVAFLFSDLASGIIGTTLRVDGGYSAK